MQKTPNIKRTSVFTIASLCLFSSTFFFQCGGNAENKGAEDKGTVESSEVSNGSSPSLARMDQAKPSPRQIDTTTAKLSIDAYMQHPNKLMIKTADYPAGQVLRGYSIKMSNIEKLLSKNPDQLFLEFGVFPDSLNSPAANQYFTLIISGYKGGKIIRDLDQDLLYEYLRPCPPNGDCPR